MINPNLQIIPKKNYKKEINLQNLTIFGRKAVHAYYKRGFTGALIGGEFAMGKTTTSVHIAREIIQALTGCTDEEAYKEAIECIKFTADEVLELTNRLSKIDWDGLTPKEVLDTKFKIREPIIIWDDAGVHASKYKHFLAMDDASALQTDFDTIRDVTSCMIITVPENEELLKFLRSYRAFYHVEINKDRDYFRTLEFWKYGKDRSGRKKKYLKWRYAPNPQFSVYLKNEYYGEYDRRRTKAKIKNQEKVIKRKQMKQKEVEYYDMKKEYYRMKMEAEMKKLEKIKNSS